MYMDGYIMYLSTFSCVQYSNMMTLLMGHGFLHGFVQLRGKSKVVTRLSRLPAL